MPSTTGKWGDAAPLFDGDDPGAPQPDFNDVAAVVQKFVATAFADMPGMTGPCACPSSVTCGAMVCVSDLVCAS